MLQTNTTVKTNVNTRCFHSLF